MKAKDKVLKVYPCAVCIEVENPTIFYIFKEMCHFYRTQLLGQSNYRESWAWADANRNLIK